MRWRRLQCRFYAKAIEPKHSIKTTWPTLGDFDCDTPDRTCSSIDDHHPEYFAALLVV